MANSRGILSQEQRWCTAPPHATQRRAQGQAGGFCCGSVQRTPRTGRCHAPRFLSHFVANARKKRRVPVWHLPPKPVKPQTRARRCGVRYVPWKTPSEHGGAISGVKAFVRRSMDFLPRVFTAAVREKGASARAPGSAALASWLLEGRLSLGVAIFTSAPAALSSPESRPRRRRGSRCAQRPSTLPPRRPGRRARASRGSDEGLITRTARARGSRRRGGARR